IARRLGVARRAAQEVAEPAAVAAVRRFRVGGCLLRAERGRIRAARRERALWHRAARAAGDVGALGGTLSAPAHAHHDGLLGMRAAPGVGLHRVHATAVAGDDAVELGERFDLLDDDAPHLRSALGSLVRQLEDAATQLAAGAVELALHLGGHLLDAQDDLAETVLR